MNQSENYTTELPEGYREVYSIDAKDKKTGILLNVAGLAAGGVIFALC